MTNNTLPSGYLAQIATAKAPRAAKNQGDALWR